MNMKKTKSKDLEYYMSLNYPFTVEQYDEDGEVRFGLEMPDLPGVWADGNRVDEAYANLVESKRLWLETCLDKGIEIPEPVSEDDFSGKFILRLPPKLHMALSKGAKRAKLSLNQYVRSILENQISQADLMAEIKKLGKTVKQHSEAIHRFERGLSTMGHRIESLEQAYSSTSEVWRTIIEAEPAEDFYGGNEVILWGDIPAHGVVVSGEEHIIMYRKE